MSKQTDFRVDIQGLRAVAVLLVLIFHVWPTALPGGYVGVDVFFVISGYLITGLLLREFEREGRISLLGFYARRIRRLLPAATLTLVATALGGYFFLPASAWSGLAQEVFASGVYVENLLLVSKSVDYLALQETASPVQHYWSLSVEEQFYILWPLLMLAAGAFARSSGRPARIVFAIALAAITLASFAYSVYMSYANPAPGYFLTTTRIWELGLGGLLAMFSPRVKPSPGVARAAGWVGVSAVLFSAWFYTTGLPFPGYEALLPTLGAAAMIFAGTAAQPRTLLSRILGLRRMQYFGDISYSLYLWHWPIIVLYPYITGRSIERFPDALTVVVLSVVAAHLSKYGVEDRLRHSPSAASGRRSKWSSAYAIGVACMVTVAAAAAVPYRSAPHMDPLAGLNTVLDKDHPGAEAFLQDLTVPTVAEFLPAPGVAKLDRGPAYGDGNRDNCIGTTTDVALSFCHFGKVDGKIHVVVIGDSHAVHWLPAFEVIGEQKGWKITAITKNSCAVTDVTVRYGKGEATRDYVECTTWNKNVLDWVRVNRPDLLIVSFSPNHRLADHLNVQRTIAEGTLRALRPLIDVGQKIALIKHTPWRLEDPPSCLTRPNATIDACSGTRLDLMRGGALVLAARAEPRLHLLDFDTAFCKGDRCPVVVGNVVVNRDVNHLTATFARSLAPALLSRIEQVDHTFQ